MKNILHSIGLDDGQGNTSSTRVIALLLTLGYLVSKFYNAHMVQIPIVWDGTDLGFIGTIGGMLIVKSHVENQSAPPTDK